MSFYSALITEALGLLHVPAPFVAILEPVLESSTKTLVADAAVAAQPIVADLEKATLPGKDKVERAVATLIADFKARGKDLAGDAAHLAVELALAKVRSLV